MSILCTISLYYLRTSLYNDWKLKEDDNVMKRVMLFLATNLFVIATITMVTSLFGLTPYLTRHGLDYRSLAIFCLVWGMSGAFISLFFSRFMAKISMGVVIINPKNATQNERYLLDMIHQLATRAGLTTMPEVGVYHSPELNAFATGRSRNHSLVAVSSGLLANMKRDEVEAVLAHEVSHIANGDMVTMTLVQGVLNAFALFLSRIAAYAVSVAMSRDSERGHEMSHMTYYILTIVFDILFTLLGSILVAAYSRWREYRADLGGAKLAGRDKMIAALQRLKMTSDIEDDRTPAFAAMKISHHPAWLEIMSSHPPIDKRIARLARMST
jgi:heat shock protein HtpX